MKDKSVFLIIFLFFLFFLLPGLHQAESESLRGSGIQEELKHEVIVILKLVQVYVTDYRGNPVTDLTKDDFILYDNGKLQTITDFEKHIRVQPIKKAEEKAEAEVKAEIKEAEPSPGPTPSALMSRKFFLILDNYQNDPVGVINSKKAALHFIDTQLQPTDEVCILSFSPYRGLVLNEYLTTDHQKIRQTIENLREIPGRPGGYQGAGLSVMSMRREEEEVESGADIPPPEDSPRGMSPIEPEDFPLILRDLAQFFKFIPGYKNIILFSAGFPRTLMYNPNDTTFRSLYEEMGKELAASNSPVFTVNAEGSRANFKPSSARGDVALQTLSNLSGGTYFKDVKQYEAIAQEINNVTSNFYVLGYYISEQWDGNFHEIKVEVKREGCRVHAQSGYFNPKPFTEFSEFERKLHLIDLVFSENPYFQEPFRFPLIALPCSSKTESNLVLLSELPNDTIKEITKTESEVATLILDKDNSIVDSSQGKVTFSLMPQRTIYHYSILSLLPGKYECRIIIRNLETGKAAVASASVAIKENPAAGVRLFPPLLLIPDKEAFYMRASKAAKENKEREPLSLNDIYPLLSNQHTPLVGCLESGTSKLLAILRCSVVEIPEPEIDISAYLVERESAQKAPLVLSILSSKAQGEADILLLELQLPELKTGDYTLEISAEEIKTHSKSEVATQFRVREKEGTDL